MSLDPPLLEHNDEFLRLLTEVLAIADADDQSLASKSSQAKHSASLTNLRCACVQLLSASITAIDPNNSNTLDPIRYKIVQVFFKSLYLKSPEVVEAAKQGLRQSISNQNKLPKDLLQTGLKPILLNLSDHKRLTVDG